MPNQRTIRSTIIRKIQRHIQEGRPEIAVLIVALCSAAVTICAALIASILLAAVIKMRKPSSATFRSAAIQRSRIRAPWQVSTASSAKVRSLQTNMYAVQHRPMPPPQAEEPSSQ
jgi:hypothetical protein